MYVTYIVATPEKVWQALTDVDLMREYWIGRRGRAGGRVNVSDWQVG